MRLFDNLVRMAAGQPPEQCGMLGQCQCQFVAEADGSVYPCDFYVLDEYRLGFIQESSFEELAQSLGMTKFLEDGRTGTSSLCEECWVRPICGGGCRRYRSFYFSKEGYCPYGDFLSACARDIRWLAKILLQESSF